MKNIDQIFCADYTAHYKATLDALAHVQAYTQEPAQLENSFKNTELHDLPYAYRALASTALLGLLTQRFVTDVVQHNPYFLGGVSARIEDIEKNYTLLACTDALTGALNRRGLEQWAQKQYKPTERSYGILYIDLTNFKNVNDTLGHDAGDAALGIATQKVASLTRVPKPLTEKTTFIDERKHDTADVLCSARVGGDELICVMDFNGLRRLEAEEVLLRIKKTLTTEKVEMQSSDGLLTSCFGFRAGAVLVGPHDPLAFEDAVRIADLRCNNERNNSSR